MPRYEQFSSEEEFQTAIDGYLSTNEVDLEQTFFCLKNQTKNSFTCPIMEDQESLVVNSITICPTSDKLSLSLEENILVRMSHLNEIAYKIFRLIMVRNFNLREGVTPKASSSGLSNKTFYQKLDFFELKMLKKVYKYNLEIFY